MAHHYNLMHGCNWSYQVFNALIVGYWAHTPVDSSLEGGVHITSEVDRGHHGLMFSVGSQLGVRPS